MSEIIKSDSCPTCTLTNNLGLWSLTGGGYIVRVYHVF